jgi:hypothetical protein
LDQSEIISNEAGSEFLFASRNTLRKYEMSGLQEGTLAEFLDFNEAEIIQTGYTNLSNIFVLLNDQLYVFAARLDKPIIQENLDFKPDGIIFSSNDSLIFIWNTKQGRLIRNSNLNSYKDLQLQVRAEVNTGLRTFQNNSEAINFETWKMLRNKIGYKE